MRLLLSCFCGLLNELYDAKDLSVSMVVKIYWVLHTNIFIIMQT